MDHYSDSTDGGAHESASTARGMGALLALAVILVLAAASARLLVAGG